MRAAEYAYSRGAILIGQDDLDGALASFDKGTSAEAGFARRLIRQELRPARTELAALRDGGDDAAWDRASRLALEVGHCFQRRNELEAAGEALRMAVELGHAGTRAEAAVFLGALCNDTGDHDGALRAWEVADEDIRFAAQVAFDLACLRQDRGQDADLERAEERYRQLIAAGTDKAGPARYQLGRLLYATGRYDESDAVLAELDQDRAAAALDAATAIYRTGALDSAEAAYTEAAESNDPKVAGPAAFNLGTLRYERGDSDGAIAAFEGALATGNTEIASLALNNLGELYADRGDLDAARAAYEKAIDGGNGEYAARAAYNLGIRLQAAGKEDQAQAAYALAETFGDPAVTAHARRRAGTETPVERGFRLAAEGDRDAALAALTEAYGSAAVAEFGLAAYGGEVGLARTALERLAAAGGTNHVEASKLGIHLADGCRQDGELETARALLEVVVAAGEAERSESARVDLAGVLHDLGEDAPAREAYARAMASGNPEAAAVAAFNFAVLLRDAGEAAAAMDAYRRAFESDAHAESAARGGLGLAELLKARGDLAGARSTLEQVAGTAIAELRGDALFELLQLCREAGDLDGVRALAERAGVEHPEVAVAGYDILGGTAWREGDLAAAVDWYQKGVAIDDPEWSPHAAYNLGLAYRGQGELAAAREVLERVQASREETIAALAAYQLGYLLYENLTDLVGAAAAWARASAGPVEQAEAARGNVLAVAEELQEAGAHEAAAVALRGLAAAGHRAQVVEVADEFATALEEAGDLPSAIPYLRCVTDNGDTEQAAWTGLKLGEALMAAGDLAGAEAAYERVGRSRDRKAAGFADFYRYELLRARDEEAATALLVRMATDPSHYLIRQAVEGGNPYITLVYGKNLQEIGRLDEAEELLRKVVDAGGEPGAEAALTLGVMAHQAGDLDTARDWWLRATEAPDPETVRKATSNLGLVAKQRRDLPAALKWFGAIAESGDEGAALAAAHIGELCYWLEEFDQAVEWYRRTLAGTTDPALVGEAAYRVGEILAGAGDVEAARLVLRQAAGSGDPSFAAQAESLLGKLPSAPQ